METLTPTGDPLVAVLSELPMLGMCGEGWRFAERLWIGWAGGAFVLALTAGCNREDPRGVANARGADPAEKAAPIARETPPSAGQVEAGTQPAALPAHAATASAKVEEDGSVISLEPAGKYRAGQAGEVRVVLEAHAPYKINDEYPFRFQLQPSDAIDYAQPVVKKDAMKLEKTRGTMRVALTPKTAGKHVVAGKFHYSVCTDDKCRFGKADLAVSITVE